MLYLPSALSKITTRLFMNDCCLLLSRTLPFGPTLLPRVGVVFGPILDIWSSRTLGYNNHRNSGSKSGICCQVRTSFLRVGAVELAFTFHVLLLLWTTTNLHSKEVEHRSKKSLEISCRQADSRLVTVSHIFVTAFSVVVGVRARACSGLFRVLRNLCVQGFG